MNGFILITGAILAASDSLKIEFTTHKGNKFGVNLGSWAGIVLMYIGWTTP